MTIVGNAYSQPPFILSLHVITGDPRDINRDPDIKVLMDCPHITFVETLVRRQFPGEYFLPDYRGIFSVPAPFSER